jgi:hypothetical protein
MRGALKKLDTLSKYFLMIALSMSFSRSYAGMINPAAKAATKKAIGKIAPPLIPVVSYLLDPDSNLIQESIEDAMLFSGLFLPDAGACSTLKCQEFADQCKVTLRLPEKTSIANVLANDRSKECVDDFLSLPLDVQAELRNDETVDSIISAYTPAIRDLKCSPSSAQVEIAQKGKLLSFQLDFTKTNSHAKLEKISGQQENGEKDRLFYNEQAKAHQLQHCQTPNDCKFFSAKDVGDRKLYAWRSDKLKTSSTALNRQLLKREAIDTPMESFRWARSAMAVADYQASRIYECCHPADTKSKVSTCEKFFGQRMQSYNQVAQKVRAPSAK